MATQRGDQDRASETVGKWLVVLLRGGRASVASSRKGRCDQKSPANNQAFNQGKTMRAKTQEKMARRYHTKLNNALANQTLVFIADKIMAQEPLDVRDTQTAVVCAKAIRRIIEFKKGQTPMVIRQAIRATERRSKDAPMVLPPRKKKEKATARPDRDERQTFYNSPEWRTLRYQALARHGATCQCCGRSRKDGTVLHVDHVKPISRFPELRLSLQNLQVLCEDCNMGKGGWDQTDWRPSSVVQPNQKPELVKLNS